MVCASSARTGTNLIAVINAKLNSYGIRAFSSARLSLSGEVVIKNRLKLVTNTMNLYDKKHLAGGKDLPPPILKAHLSM